MRFFHENCAKAAFIALAHFFLYQVSSASISIKIRSFAH